MHSPGTRNWVLTVNPMPTVAEKEPGMNLPWSNWTSRDVFPTPLSPTRIVCKDQVKRSQCMGAGGARACRYSMQPGAGNLGRGCWGDAAGNTAGSGGTSLAPDHGRAVGPMETPWQPPCPALPSSRLSQGLLGASIRARWLVPLGPVPCCPLGSCHLPGEEFPPL